MALGRNAQEGIESPDIVMDSYDLSNECQESEPSPLEERPVFITTEPSPQPLTIHFKMSLPIMPYTGKMYGVVTLFKE